MLRERDFVLEPAPGSRATIADLEAGKRGAYRSTVKKLARALKVKPHELEG
jgi:helix-turn-helix protein